MVGLIQDIINDAYYRERIQLLRGLLEDWGMSQVELRKCPRDSFSVHIPISNIAISDLAVLIAVLSLHFKSVEFDDSLEFLCVEL